MLTAKLACWRFQNRTKYIDCRQFSIWPRLVYWCNLLLCSWVNTELNNGQKTVSPESRWPLTFWILNVIKSFLSFQTSVWNFILFTVIITDIFPAAYTLTLDVQHIIGSSSIPSEEIYRAHENGRDGQTLRKHNAPSYGCCQCRRNKSVTQSTRIQCYSLYTCTRAENWKASDLSSFFSCNQEILITKSFLVMMMHLLLIFKQKVSIIFSSLCASSTLICTLSTVYVDKLFSVVSQKC